MYSRQYRTSKNSSNSSDKPAPSQFAPRPFAPYPTSETVTPQQQQTPDLHAQKSESGLIDGSKLTPRPTPARTPRIQMKLTIGQSGDKYEQEADRMAADVVQRINAPQSESVQRQEIPEEDDVQMKSIVQRLSVEGGTAATPDIEESIQGAKGGGQPLAENIKEPMEKAFGADFSGVKVHTDAQSDQLNQSIQAKAFTTGQDVFFRQGAYEPGSRGGQELIAHELTHVVQQNGGAVQRALFPNKMEENFGPELTEANEAAMEKDYLLGPGPYAQDTDGFKAFINKGEMFKWIFSEKNGLVVISPTLKHSVAAGGGEVITAGHGQKTAEGKIWINNDTGHYQTTLESLKLSLPAWTEARYQVETRERTDFAAVFNNMGGGQQKQCNIM